MAILESRSFYSLILRFVSVEWMPWASTNAQALSSVSHIRLQIKNLPENLIFVYCDGENASAVERHWRKCRLIFNSGVICKNLNKTVAFQALYPTYFLLEVRIMCLLNEN